GGRGVHSVGRPLLRDQEDRVHLKPMRGFQRTATNIIVALTALAWVVAIWLGQSEQAALALGFIPARLSAVPVPWPAAPAVLTPLTATLVHSGLVHLGFNLLIMLWCGMAVER